MTLTTNVVTQDKCVITTERNASADCNATVVKLDFSHVSSTEALVALSMTGGLRRPSTAIWDTVKDRLIQVLDMAVGVWICTEVRPGSTERSIELELNVTGCQANQAKNQLAKFLRVGGIDCVILQ